VAGAAALIRARFPQLKAADVVKRLTATAIDKGSPGRDPEYGYGVINLVAALTADVPLATESPSTATGGPKAGPSTPDKPSWPLLLLILGGGAAVVIGLVMWARRRRRSGAP